MQRITLLYLISAARWEKWVVIATFDTIDIKRYCVYVCFVSDEDMRGSGSGCTE